MFVKFEENRFDKFDYMIWDRKKIDRGNKIQKSSNYFKNLKISTRREYRTAMVNHFEITCRKPRIQVKKSKCFRTDYFIL